MFPFVTVVECPESRMLEAIGPTLVCSAITCNETFRKQLLDAVHIDRLNLGPVPTTQLNWLQPHEGNIVEFLFRARAFQTADLGHEDPLDHRRRRRDVLRQLLPRQRARDGADGARPRRDASAGLHADADRRAERQPPPRAVWRHQRLPAAACGAVPEDAALPRSAVGFTGRHPGVREPRRFHRCAAARRHDDFDAAGHPGRASQGVRQAGRVDPRRAAARRHQPAELAARRHGRAAARCAEAAGVLHAAGRGALSERPRGALPGTGDRPDPAARAHRGPLHRGQRVLRHLHVRAAGDSGRPHRRRSARDQHEGLRAAGRRRRRVPGGVFRARGPGEGTARAGRRLRTLPPPHRGGAGTARSGRLYGAGPRRLSERRAPCAPAGRPCRRVFVSGRARSRRASSRFFAGWTSCPCRRPTTSRKGCFCSRRWRAACPSCSRGAADSSRSSRRPAAACSSIPGLPVPAPTIPRAWPTRCTGCGAIAAWLRTLSARAFEGVRAHYTIEQSASRLLDVYEAVLKSESPLRSSVA